ncbi:MAG: hypothetical protein ABIR94_09975 [Rubrivivax sp.]
MNLLLWMVAGMVIGSVLLSVGRARNDVAILLGLLAGAAGAVVAGVWATNEAVATKLFGQSLSGLGLLAAATGAGIFAVVLRLLWHPGERSQTLAAMEEMDAMAAKMPGARDRHTSALPTSTRDQRLRTIDGDTRPSAFDGRHPPATRASAAPESAANLDVHPGLGVPSKQVPDPR